ncbi:hypothetical protein HDV06_004046 [Boothiomyces sp. JEL0866]|nr:hypothetical protein HDV06_004046 [Boothiomyces sp. JEL0866]
MFSPGRADLQVGVESVIFQQKIRQTQPLELSVDIKPQAAHTSTKMNMFQEQFPTLTESNNTIYEPLENLDQHLLAPRDAEILRSPYGKTALSNKVSPDVAVHTVLHSDLNLPQVTDFFYPPNASAMPSNCPAQPQILVTEIVHTANRFTIEKEDFGFACPLCNVKLRHSRSMKSHLKTKHELYARIEGDQIQVTFPQLKSSDINNQATMQSKINVQTGTKVLIYVNQDGLASTPIQKSKDKEPTPHSLSASTHGVKSSNEPKSADSEIPSTVSESKTFVGSEFGKSSRSKLTLEQQTYNLEEIHSFLERALVYPPFLSNQIPSPISARDEGFKAIPELYPQDIDMFHSVIQLDETDQ